MAVASSCRFSWRALLFTYVVLRCWASVVSIAVDNKLLYHGCTSNICFVPNTFLDIPMRPSQLLLRSETVTLLVAVALFALTNSANANPKLFAGKVAPILQKHCLRCHNSTDHKGDFSIESDKDVFESGYVEKGNAIQSHLLAVITSQDGKPPQMPKNGKPLSPKEVEVIRSWIDGGAAWPAKFKIEEPEVTSRDWWSLKPVVRGEVPALQSDWVQTPIDAFILAKLQQAELKPAPKATKLALVRRLYYDLHGLPPTPEEVDAFVNDDAVDAYDRLVDRLLDSPRYGERWARHWLDVVKYADTCGYDKDKLRPNAFPYRDYVIRSFNNDKPYSRFVQEQLAGDILFPGEPDGILGLGFIAAGPWDFIGHVEVPETKIDGRIARHIDRDEMVSNTMNTFTSITIQCCRCHNHKFDPFTQEHYYNLQAVFAAVDRAERPYDTDPFVERRKRQLLARKTQVQSELSSIEAKVKAEGGQALVDLEARVKTLRAKAALKPKNPAYGFHGKIEKSQMTTKWVQVDLGAAQELTSIVLHPCHDEYNNIGAGFGFPVRYRVEISNAADFNNKKEVIAERIVEDRTKSDFGNPGIAPVEIKLKRRAGRFIRITATKLARRLNDYIFALSEVEALDASGKNVALKTKVTSTDSIQAPVRWARANLTDGIWPEAKDPEAAKQLSEANAELNDLLSKLNTKERSKRRDELQQQRTSIDRELSGIPAGKLVYAAATQFKARGGFNPTMGKPRVIKVLHRGNILSPRDLAVPGTVPLFEREAPKFDLPKNHTEGQRRVALAKWIVRPDNPLTWRSIVNRVWLYHFGRGIVETPNDFGRMGQLPSHPELLDWLASEFRDGGQSIKQLHRLILTSAVYQQSSIHPGESVQAAKNPTDIDGGNALLWKMNRRRLEAEEIRDAVLSVSGRMSPTMFGPGFYLFKLERTAHSPHYEYHKFDPEDIQSHRRSVYRFIVRSQPDPFMTTLDCADSSQSTPQRNETLTSLQALSLLNNKFTLAMSKHMERRLQTEAKSAEDQVSRAVRLVAGRIPSDFEKQELTKYANEHGLANLCRVLFNTSEFIFLD